MVGESICALKVKYLKEIENKEGSEIRVMNKLIGLSHLKESSDVKVMQTILTEKILINDVIKGNLVGLSNDNASTLYGEDNGLVGLLKKSIPQSIYTPLHKSPFFSNIF